MHFFRVTITLYSRILNSFMPCYSTSYSYGTYAYMIQLSLNFISTIQLILNLLSIPHNYILQLAIFKFNSHIDINPYSCMYVSRAPAAAVAAAI